MTLGHFHLHGRSVQKHLHLVANVLEFQCLKIWYVTHLYVYVFFNFKMAENKLKNGNLGKCAEALENLHGFLWSHRIHFESFYLNPEG